MNSSSLIFIAVLAFVWVLIKLAPKLFVRQVARVALTKVGEKAIANVPEQIALTRVTTPQWKDANAVQQQANPLVVAGFNDLGIYAVDKMPGVLVRVLFQPQTHVAAHIFEHPKAGSWIELATRYTDGSSDFLTTLPDQGIQSPSFVRTTRASRSTPTDALYQQHIAQRKNSGIKTISQNDVIHEFEDAYMRYMVWKKDKSLTPEEVAKVTLQWAKAKGATAGQS